MFNSRCFRNLLLELLLAAVFLPFNILSHLKCENWTGSSPCVLIQIKCILLSKVRSLYFGITPHVIFPALQFMYHKADGLWKEKSIVSGPWRLEVGKQGVDRATLPSILWWCISQTHQRAGSPVFCVLRQGNSKYVCVFTKLSSLCAYIYMIFFLYREGC